MESIPSPDRAKRKDTANSFAKHVIAGLFEPIWFAIFCLSAGILLTTPTHNRLYRKIRAETTTARSTVTIMRIMSKRFSREMPFFLPVPLLFSLIVGAHYNGWFGAVMGIAAMITFFVLLPVLIPAPSSLIEFHGTDADQRPR